MSGIHVFQAIVLAGLVGLAVERVRAICVRGPIDVDLLVKAARVGGSGVIARAGGAFAARAIAPWFEAEPAEREVAVEEALADAKTAIVARLQWIRIGATFSSFLGFVGAAIALGSLYYGEHGLEALDGPRFQARALGDAALSIALGVGGSSFALGTWMTLRGFARRLVGECDRAVERVRAG